MRCRLFLPSDLSFISACFKSRDLPRSSMESMPKLGLIVEDLSFKPIAAGFLRNLEDSTCAMLDGYVTDPTQPGEVRDKALDLLTKELIDLATKRGITTLLALSIDNNTISRSYKHGFNSVPHVVLTLALNTKAE